MENSGWMGDLGERGVGGLYMRSWLGSFFFFRLGTGKVEVVQGEKWKKLLVLVI